MELNKLDKKILNILKVGENIITVSKLALILSLSRPTITKYLGKLEKLNLIKKITIGNPGGTSGDATKKTIIYKL